MTEAGHEAVHTSWLPDQNRTKDGTLRRLADAEHRDDQRLGFRDFAFVAGIACETASSFDGKHAYAAADCALSGQSKPNRTCVFCSKFCRVDGVGANCSRVIELVVQMTGHHFERQRENVESVGSGFVAHLLVIPKLKGKAQETIAFEPGNLALRNIDF